MNVPATLPLAPTRAGGDTGREAPTGGFSGLLERASARTDGGPVRPTTSPRPGTTTVTDGEPVTGDADDGPAGDEAALLLLSAGWNAVPSTPLATVGVQPGSAAASVETLADVTVAAALTADADATGTTAPVVVDGAPVRGALGGTVAAAGSIDAAAADAEVAAPQAGAVAPAAPPATEGDDALVARASTVLVADVVDPAGETAEGAAPSTGAAAPAGAASDTATTTAPVLPGAAPTTDVLADGAVDQVPSDTATTDTVEVAEPAAEPAAATVPARAARTAASDVEATTTDVHAPTSAVTTATSAAPTQAGGGDAASSTVARILDLVAQLEDAPPPRVVVIETGEVRLRLGLDNGVVRLTALGPLGDHGEALLQEAADALESNGFGADVDRQDEGDDPRQDDPDAPEAVPLTTPLRPRSRARAGVQL